MITAALIFCVAFLYASVGHGGASGYLAVLTLFGYSAAQMASSALVLNLFVAGIATFSFWRAGFFSWRLAAPFIIGSIPFAILGGWQKVSPTAYSGLLAGALLVAAVRLFYWNGNGGAKPTAALPRFKSGRLAQLYAVPVMLGSGIGYISGVVGVGGGIFLSPILLFFRWASIKQTAAVSAFFIVVNSLAGISGRVIANQWNPALVLPFVLPAVLGGIAGSVLGARTFSSLTLRRILSIVLLVAAWKALR